MLRATLLLLALCCGAAGLTLTAWHDAAPALHGLGAAGLRHRSSCRRRNDTNIAFSMAPPLPYRQSGGMQCGLDHSEDLYRPIPKVLASHPGVDGNCYFECHAPWMTYLGEISDYVGTGQNAVRSMRGTPGMCPLDPGLDKGPLTDLHYLGDAGGRNTVITLHSHLDCMHMRGDDVYCHALGWLKNQGVDGTLMSNATAWREQAARSCEGFQQKYGFTDAEITVGKHIDDQKWIWGGPARNLVLHAYHKCLLGHAPEEMAYCMSLGCLLPGNVVGHGRWCE